MTISTTDDPLVSIYGHLSDIVQAMSGALVVLRDDGVITEINPATSELFETAPENILWQPIQGFFISNGYSLDEMFDFLVDPNTKRDLRVHGLVRTAKGRELEVLVSMRLIGHLQPGVTQRSAVCTLLDITTERKLQRDLAYAHKLQAVAQLATGVVHELSTPVQFLGDHVHFLSDSIAELAEASSMKLTGAGDGVLVDLKRSIAEAQKGLERIHEIIDAVRGFSHPRKQARTPTALRPIIDDALVVARSGYKHVAQVEVHDEQTRLALCCPADIRQVVLSLIVNAAQAIEESCRDDLGTIRVELVNGKGSSVVIRVADDGPGVPESLAQRIFEPFFSTKEEAIGTGQGLTIARQLVEAQGGSLRLQRPSCGATFEICLPGATEH